MVGTFDTLRAARRLREAGASEPVAEAIAERESREFDLSQLATKSDLEQLRYDLEQCELLPQRISQRQNPSF